MQKKIISLGFIIAVALLVVGSVQLVLAVNDISANPGHIVVGQKVIITLTTEAPATGTITVNQTATPGSTWSLPISVPAGVNTWTFPDDWPAGANTDVPGYYDVVADILMIVGRFEWETQFQAGFIVIPEVLGPIMALIACFGAVIGYTRIKAIK